MTLPAPSTNCATRRRSPQTEAVPPAAPVAPIAITQGDSAGIGPEIIVRAFAEAPDALRGCFVVGALAVLRRAAAVVAQARGGQPAALTRLHAVAELAQVPPHTLAVLELPGLGAPQPWGRVSAQAGQDAARCIAWAANAALRGAIAALVTAPINKAALHAAGVPFAGHTEMLQDAAARHAGVPVQRMPVRMLLASGELRTVLLSIHVPLRQAIRAVTQPNIVETLHITHHALQRALGRAPRIAVAGLNPHAGEGGLFGDEEEKIIAPAIAQARALLPELAASGPFAPDTIFWRARRKNGHNGEFDVVLAMYHDQGLIPVKYGGLENGVNVTLGLPLVRTSPDHGTAFDIAGRGVADARSLIAAVRMARSL